MIEISALTNLIITGILRGAIYTLIAMGLTLIFGVINIPNFAHGEYYMLGAYIAYFAITSLGVDASVAFVVAALGVFLAGVLTERVVFFPLRARTREGWIMNTFLVTVGISVFLQNFALYAWRAEYRGITRFWHGVVDILGLMVPVDRIAVFFASMAFIIVFWLVFTRTRIGRAIRAMAQDELAAMLCGIDPNLVYPLTFGLGAMMAGLAGAMLLPLLPAYPTMGLNPLYKAWFVVILVGLGNVGATIVGGFLVGFLETIAYFMIGAGWQNLITLVVLIILLIIKPYGLFGAEAKGIWEK